jgi:hypothetical protein
MARGDLANGATYRTNGTPQSLRSRVHTRCRSDRSTRKERSRRAQKKINTNVDVYRARRAHHVELDLLRQLTHGGATIHTLVKRNLHGYEEKFTPS